MDFNKEQISYSLDIFRNTFLVSIKMIKKRIFNFSWGQNVYHCVWYHCFWYQMKDTLICDKAKKKKKNPDQNNYPIKKYSTFCEGNEKWEISETTVKEKASA